MVQRGAAEACDAATGNQASVSGDQAAGCTYTCTAAYAGSEPDCDVAAVCARGLA